jgi:catechol 2,3-dioxygenase-like lactoylglutathione lyase family enzyme
VAHVALVTRFSIDSVFLAVANLGDACRPYERLGLKLSPARDGRRTLSVGGPANLFAIHFLADADPGSPLAGPLRRALAAGRSLFALALGVEDLDGVLGQLEKKSLAAARFGEGGDEMAWLPLHERAGVDLVLVRHTLATRERHEEAVRSGLLAHALPLKRLDHLAIVTHDLEEQSRFWSDVLGVPVAGEVLTPALVIRQLRIGDAVLELLGPASAGSPLRQRPPGLAGMASWEVGDLDESVRLARAAGFTVSDPAHGPLPGTRIATVQGSELAGVNQEALTEIAKPYAKQLGDRKDYDLRCLSNPPASPAFRHPLDPLEIASGAIDSSEPVRRCGGPGARHIHLQGSLKKPHGFPRDGHYCQMLDCRAVFRLSRQQTPDEIGQRSWTLRARVRSGAVGDSQSTDFYSGESRGR